MGKVKDTESFIARAIEIHGTKYDYSQTIYAGSNKPITIICRLCGPVVLSEAWSHYRIDKKCGCRKCEQEETLVRIGRAKHCLACGERVRYHGPNTLCTSCRSELSDQWSCALSFAESKLLTRIKRRNQSGWERWLKIKSTNITARSKVAPRMPTLRAKKIVGNWDKWVELSVRKVSQRKAESEWNSKLRRWALSLSRRERKLEENNSGS